MEDAKDFRDSFKSELLKTKINCNTTKKELEIAKERLSSIVSPYLPSTLFRFRTCNSRNFDALLNNKIYAVPTSYMNDPHDGLVYVNSSKLLEQIKYALSKDFINEIRQCILDNSDLPSYMKSLFPIEQQSKIKDYIRALTNEDIIEISNKNQDNLENIQKDLNLFINSQIKSLHDISLIASFVEEIDNFSMWAYYADDQKGFALEYPTQNGRFDLCFQCQNSDANSCIEKAVTTRIYPVIYDNERFDATEWFDYKIGQLILNNMGIIYQEIPDKLFYDKICLFKSIPWKHENEWRMICYPKFDGYSGSPVSVPSVSPIAIYYGVKIQPENKNILQNIVKTLNKNDCNIKEYQMNINHESLNYDLEAKEL